MKSTFDIFNPENNRTVTINSRQEFDAYIIGMNRNEHAVSINGSTLYGFTKSYNPHDDIHEFDIVAGDGWTSDGLNSNQLFDNVSVGSDEDTAHRVERGGYAYVAINGSVVRYIEPMECEFYEDIPYTYSSTMPGQHCRDADAGHVLAVMYYMRIGDVLKVSVSDGHAVNLAVVKCVASEKFEKCIIMKSTDGLERMIKSNDDVWEFMIRFQPYYNSRMPLYVTCETLENQPDTIGQTTLSEYHITTNPQYGKPIVTDVFKDGCLERIRMEV